MKVTLDFLRFRHGGHCLEKLPDPSSNYHSFSAKVTMLYFQFAKFLLSHTRIRVVVELWLQLLTLRQILFFITFRQITTTRTITFMRRYALLIFQYLSVLSLNEYVQLVNHRYYFS